MSITATVTSQPITANVAGSGISANVGSSLVTASASGGIGPQGASGAAGGSLSDIADIQLSSVADGDVLRYSSSKWRNYAESNLIFDAGNF